MTPSETPPGVAQRKPQFCVFFNQFEEVLMHSIQRASLMAMIALAMTTLVSCGGDAEDTPRTFTADLPAISLSPANASLAKVVGAALVGKSLSLPSAQGFLDNSGQTPNNFPASTLSFSALPANAPSNAIASVTLKNEHYQATGFAFPGSLNIVVNSLIWQGSPIIGIWTPMVWIYQPLTIWPLQTFSFFAPNFQVDFDTLGLPDGLQTIAANANIGPYNLPITTTANVSSNSNNSATIAIGDTSLTVEKTTSTNTSGPTGATGGTGGTGSSGGVN